MAALLALCLRACAALRAKPRDPSRDTAKPRDTSAAKPRDTLRGASTAATASGAAAADANGTAVSGVSGAALTGASGTAVTRGMAVTSSACAAAAAWEAVWPVLVPLAHEYCRYLQAHAAGWHLAA